MERKDSIAVILETVTGYEVKKEWKFHNLRKWRFDLAITELKLAVEWEGGIWNRGRHVRGKGYINDMEKYNAAAMEGWTVLRYAPDQVDRMLDEVIGYIERSSFKDKERIKQ